MNAGPLDFIPLWALCLATIAAGLLSVEAGYQIGRQRQLRSETEKESSVGIMGAATLSLLAFALAFTFALVVNRFEVRRQLNLDEANAIRTSHLRSTFLAEPQRSTIRDLLRKYFEARFEASQPGKTQQALIAARRMQSDLWAEAVAAVKNGPNSILAGLFIESINEVISLYEKQLEATLQSRLPGIIWATLYLVASFSMAGIGYHEGLTSRQRSPAVVMLILAFSVVLYLIADLDRPQDGSYNVSQQAMLDLRWSFEETRDSTR